MNLGKAQIDEVERLISRLDLAAKSHWRNHPVLISDIDLAIAYLRKMIGRPETVRETNK